MDLQILEYLLFCDHTTSFDNFRSFWIMKPIGFYWKSKKA